MSIRVHYHDAAGRLAGWLPRLQALLPKAIDDVLRWMPIDQVDIVCHASTSVIPELGLNGFSEHRNLLFMKLDPDNPNLAANFDTSVPSLLAHEMHHCLRDGTVGYGRSLREALVSEGLACQFEIEVTGRTPIYANALNEEQLQDARVRTAPLLDAACYDHSSWFFGNRNQGVPRHCCYSLGFAIVGEHMVRSGRSASELVAVPASEFYP